MRWWPLVVILVIGFPVLVWLMFINGYFMHGD